MKSVANTLTLFALSSDLQWKCYHRDKFFDDDLLVKYYIQSEAFLRLREECVCFQEFIFLEGWRKLFTFFLYTFDFLALSYPLTLSTANPPAATR